MIWTTNKPTKPGWYWVDYTDRRTHGVSAVSLDILYFHKQSAIEIFAETFEDIKWSDEPIPMPFPAPPTAQTPERQT